MVYLNWRYIVVVTSPVLQVCPEYFVKIFSISTQIMQKVVDMSLVLSSYLALNQSLYYLNLSFGLSCPTCMLFFRSWSLFLVKTANYKLRQRYNHGFEPFRFATLGGTRISRRSRWDMTRAHSIDCQGYRLCCLGAECWHWGVTSYQPSCGLGSPVGLDWCIGLPATAPQIGLMVTFLW